MISKKLRRQLGCVLVSGISLVAIACSLKLGEEAPTQKPFVYPETCLSESYVKLGKLIDAKAEDQDINFAMDCMGQILGRLRDKVRGEKKEFFKDTEIAEFIESNFFEDNSGRKISPEFLHQGMLIKQLFVGGSDKIFTRDELTKAISFVRRLKSQLVSINPYVQVLLQKWEVRSLSADNRDLEQYERDIEYFEQANLALQSFVDYLATELEENRQGYDLANIPTLAFELDMFDGVNDGISNGLRTYMPLIMKLKKALSGGQENMVLSSEWRNFGVLGSRGYIQYLRYLYFIAKAPDSGMGSQLPYIAKAAEEIFDTMSYLVAQKPEQLISRQEILEIFGAFTAIFPEIRMSDALLLEAMKFKQILLGGQLDALTDRDFLVAKSRVPVFRTIAEKIAPYFRVYVRDWDAQHSSPSESKRFFNEAFVQLLQSVLKLKPHLVASYDINDLAKLIDELNRLYPPSGMTKSEAGTLDSVKKYLPLFVSIKELVSDGKGSRIEVDQWGSLLEYGVDGLQSYLYYIYFIEPEKDPLKMWDESSQLVQLSASFLQSLALAKSSKQILNSEILAILQTMKDLNIFIPEDLTGKTIWDVLDACVNRLFLAPADRFRLKDKWVGFSVLQIQQLQKDLQSLIYTLRFTDSLTVGKTIPYAEFQAALDLEISRADLPVEIGIALREVRLLASGPVPSNFDEEGRMYITSDEVRTSRSSLRLLDASRLIAALLVRSFAEVPERVNTLVGGAINIDEAKRFFKILGPVLTDLKLIKKIDDSFVNSRFLEANIFVPRGQYDMWASYIEMSELVVHMLSGLKVNTQVTDAFRAAQGDCRIENPDNEIPLVCYQKITKEVYSTKFPQTPRLGEAVKNMSTADWTIFINASILAAGYEGSLGDKIKLSDMNLVPHFIQYLEMLFAKFDVNRNNLMSTEESALAFPTFEVILKEAAKEFIDGGYLKESEVYDLFTYILKNSKKPTSTIEKINFKLNWIGKSEKWNLAVDRKSIGVTLKYISENIVKNARHSSERKEVPKKKSR